MNTDMDTSLTNRLVRRRINKNVERARQALKNKYLGSSKRRVMVFDNNCIFRPRISQSELCF